MGATALTKNKNRVSSITKIKRSKPAVSASESSPAASRNLVWDEEPITRGAGADA